MTLHTDIQSIIEKLSNDVLRSTILANILADTSDEFKDNPAIKNVLKEMLTDGIGSSILALDHESESTRAFKCQAIVSDFIKKRGYNADVVKYLTDCILYALGWISTVVPLDSDVEYNHEKGADVSHDNSTPPIDLQKTLESMKLDYVNSLGSYYTYPAKKFFYTKPGYFSADAASKLLLIEQKIDIVAQALGIDMKSWCLTQKELFEKNNQVSSSAIKKQILTRLVAPIIALLITAGGVGFKVKKDSVEENFYATMQIVESAFSASNYDEAFAQCIAAKEISELSFGSSELTTKANDKLEQIISANETDLVKAGKFDEATNWLNSLSKQYGSDQKVASLLNHHQESLDARKMAELNEGLPNLINDISRNAGKLSAEGKETLRRLLVMDPENYWLKIISAKELK